MPNKKYDVVALGELLIDFTQDGLSDQGNPLLEANPGGAPCNVLAMLQKLGHTTAFLGKVGQDSFGSMLCSAIKAQGIDASALQMDPSVHTTLAFVHTKPDGDRDFSFYRNPGADELLRQEEVPVSLIQESKIFHFGTLSLTHPFARTATQKAVAAALDSGVLTSFDPNLRPPLWRSEDEMRNALIWGLDRCCILKIADNELEFLTGQTDFDKGVSLLRSRHSNLELITVTAGAKGSYAYYKDMCVYVPGFTLGNTIETTGAGDCFCGNVLGYILDHGLENLSSEDLTAMLRFANAAAYLVTTKKGALRVMPEVAEIKKILSL